MKRTFSAIFAAAYTFLLAASAPVQAQETAAEEEKPEAAAEAPDDTATTAAEAPREAPKTSSSRDFTVIRLGSEEIKNSEAEELWKGLFPGGAAPDFATFDEKIRQNVLRGIVSERLIYSQAVREGFDKSEEVKKRLAALEKQLVMQTFMESKAKSLVTDAQLKEAYNERIASTKNEEEMRARHILVASEEEAKAIAKGLKKGGDFEALAKEKSLDKGSAIQGGDLGYFTKEKMVPEFSAAVFKLKKGEISDPIKSSFGWHVVRVEDRRPVKVPPIEELREELESEVSNKLVQDYVEGLLKKADIKYYGTDGKEKAFSRSLEAPKE